MFIEYYFYYLYYTFLAYPFVMRVAIAGLLLFSFFFFLAMCVFCRATISFRLKKKYQKKIDWLYTSQLEIILTSCEDFTAEDVRRMLGGRISKLKDRHKRILTNRMILIRNKSSNVNMKNYRRVVQFFELQDFWEKKLKYGSLTTKMLALRKSDDLYVEIPGAIISPLTYNRNPYLRRRARSYYMYYSNNNPYKFLDENFDRTFNDWDRIELHRMLFRRQKDGLPSFSQWIKNSDNTFFICFLIDEIAFFRQEENAPFLIELSRSDEARIQKHSIEALGKLKYRDAEKVLTSDYVTQPVSIQTCIVRTIGLINSGEALSFLEEAYHSATTNSLRITILHVIFNYGASGKATFAKLKQYSRGFDQLIFDHVSHPLIKAY